MKKKKTKPNNNMATTTAPKKARASTNKKLVAGEIAVGDVFSEVSHYTFLAMKGEDMSFLHHGSKETVTLNKDYVEQLLCTANQWHSEVEVGKEDKYWTEKRIQEATARGDLKDLKVLPNPGDVMVPGIRTIWENIHSAQVFKVCYKKQDTPLSTKKLDELREAQITKALDAIDKAQKAKKGIAAAAQEQLKNIQENPILPYEEGEMRELVGYKVQFTSRDGKYQCMDMVKKEQRPVNINTLDWLVFDGVKYTVEK